MCQTQWVSAGLAAMPLHRRVGVLRAIWKSSGGNVTNLEGLRVHQHTVCKVHMIKERKTLDALWKHLCEQIYWAAAVVPTCETHDSKDKSKLLLKPLFFCSKWSILASHRTAITWVPLQVQWRPCFFFQSERASIFARLARKDAATPVPSSCKISKDIRW